MAKDIGCPSIIDAYPSSVRIKKLEANLFLLSKSSTVYLKVSAGWVADDDFTVVGADARLRCRPGCHRVGLAGSGSPWAGIQRTTRGD